APDLASRNHDLAFGGAAVEVVLVAVVAGLVPQAVDAAVAAAGNGAAPRGAAGLAVGRQVAAVVARFHAGLHHTVATERAEALATRETAPVAAVVDAVVADLVAVHDAVAALRRADRPRPRELAQRQLVRRSAHPALGLEDGDLVDLSDRHAESGRRRR